MRKYIYKGETETTLENILRKIGSVDIRNSNILQEDPLGEIFVGNECELPTA